ncbi:MAG: YggT family protein [Candidatus Magasanikiibacteriota bacterium]
MDSHNSPSTKTLYHGTQIVWYLVVIIEVLLTFRFLLKLFNAYSGAGFTNFIYTVSKPLVIPFTSVFSVSKLDNNLFEWTTLLAMIVYLLIGWGIVRFFFMTKTVSVSEAASKLN